MYGQNYFDEHVVMSVEIESEYYGRRWTQMKGSKIKSYLDNLSEDESLSDIDYYGKQPDPWVRKVLNTAHYNWFNNQKWWQKMNFTSLDDVINYIIDNDLVTL